VTFLGSGAVYAGTVAMQRAVMFLLLPIFTRVLTTSQYGRLSIALSANAVAVVIFAFGMEPAIFRAAVHLVDVPRDRDRFLRSIWAFLLLAPPLAAAAVTAVMALFLSSSSAVSVGDLGLSMLAASLYVAGTTLPLTLLRADRRLRDFVALNAITTITTAGLTLGLVAVAHAGVTGWLVAVNISSAATLLAAIVIVPYRRPRPFDGAVVRKALRRSLPLMPHFAAMWSLQLADRVLLAALVTTSAVGVYSLASNIALPLLVLTIGVSQGFMPAYAEAGKSSSTMSLGSLIELHVAVVCGLSLACALLAPVAINVFLDVHYRPAVGLTPWIVLGYGLLGLYSIPMNGVTLTHGRSRHVWLVSATGAAVNLGLIYLLVPGHGLIAAAVASAIGYGVLLVGVGVYSVRTASTLPYPWRPISALVLVGSLAYAAGVLTVHATDVIDILLRLGWIIAAAAAMTAIVGRRGRGLVRSAIGLRKLRYGNTT
jgi:O-antigen/teichoic acid export membrane protein